jgi:hypothetical protein
MPSSSKNIPSQPPSLRNAFSRDFLRLLDERDEPITAAEADMAGPWRVLRVPGQGFGVFREGEPPSRGFRPVAVFADRFLALLAAAVLPGTGREPLLSLAGDPDPDGHGYAVRLDDGTVVGHCVQFEEELVGSMNTVVSILRGPGSLAYELEAAGAVTLERAGAILADRLATAAAEGGP